MSETEELPFELVIGLEIHIQLLTKSKAFCSDEAEYGAMPNTQISPISLAHPGTLPKHNKEAINKAIMMGLALHCNITRLNHYSRKNYFYADLPKGYQITQFNTPLCVGGFVTIRLKDGSEKNIRLTRIHMEEDTGKSMHDQDLHDSLIDYNRAGTPLIEVVTEPDIKSGEEAYAFVTEIRKLVRYLEICDGNMEEGSLRCDANVSIRRKGASEFGTKVEVKNMNSISNVKRAIDYELIRQTELLNSGGTISGETRRFDAMAGKTYGMRSKELVNDYRYFPEPDLPPLHVTDKMLDEVKSRMPSLPVELYQKFTKQYGLGYYDAGVLTDDRDTAEYFDKVCHSTSNYKAASNWVSVHIKGYLNENALELSRFEVTPEKIGELIALIDDGKISNSTASQNIFPEMIRNSHESPLDIATRLNMIQSMDEDFIEKLAKDALAKYPEKVTEYKQGKTNLLGLFVGEVMKNGRGKADPRKVNEWVVKLLNS